jgi:hypothetical protein
MDGYLTIRPERFGRERIRIGGVGTAVRVVPDVTGDSG